MINSCVLENFTFDSVCVRLGRFPRGKFQVQITRSSLFVGVESSRRIDS